MRDPRDMRSSGRYWRYGDEGAPIPPSTAAENDTVMTRYVVRVSTPTDVPVYTDEEVGLAVATLRDVRYVRVSNQEPV